MTYVELLTEIARALEPRAGASARAEAERILLAAARPALTRVDLYSRAPAAPELAGGARRLAAMRAAGQLLQHVLGRQEFLEHEYIVDASVLIPRPETEVLARAAIETLRDHPPARGIEIGLGSGILSIELLAAFPHLRMTASELSPAAAAVARRNARAILAGKIEKVEIANTDTRLTILEARDPREVWEPFLRECAEVEKVENGKREERDPFPADFLISNPPYLLAGEAADDVAAQEPAAALWALPEDPLYFYRQIAARAPEFLVNGGRVFLELPHERARAIEALFAPTAWESVELRADLNGCPRVLCARRTRKPGERPAHLVSDPENSVTGKKGGSRSSRPALRN